MKKRKDLLLDVDEVVCFPNFLKAINEFLETNYQIDDFTDYYIDEIAIPKEKFNEFNRFISKRNLYDSPHILPNAVETIQKLNDLYNIYIYSSCINPFNISKSGKLFKDKYDFLINTLPFINPENFIFTSVKRLFRADIQIDDRLQNLDRYVETRILFPSYHNKDITDKTLAQNNILRAGYDWRDGWKEIEHILLDNTNSHSKVHSLKK